jgi:hypothetical protein
MNAIYFYIYLLLVLITTVSYTILRCVFKEHSLDMFFYPNNANNIIENKVYLSSHIIISFILGLLFGFNIIGGMFVKIIIFEVYLYFFEHCDVFIVSKPKNLIIIILITLISYVAGCIINTIFSKS